MPGRRSCGIPLLALTLASVGALEAQHSAPPAAAAAGPYGPYAFLIGEWNVGPDEGGPAAVARFRWGPGRSYIWYSVSTLANGTEQPHFEGLLL